MHIREDAIAMTYACRTILKCLIINLMEENKAQIQQEHEAVMGAGVRNPHKNYDQLIVTKPQTYRRYLYILMLFLIATPVVIIGLYIGNLPLVALAFVFSIGPALLSGSIRLDNQSIRDRSYLPWTTASRAEIDECHFYRIKLVSAHSIRFNVFVITSTNASEESGHYVLVSALGYMPGQRRTLFSQLYQWLKSSPCIMDVETEKRLRRLAN
jgi:hypothetical protein